MPAVPSRQSGLGLGLAVGTWGYASRKSGGSGHSGLLMCVAISGIGSFLVEATEEDTLGGHAIPQGGRVLVSPQLIHKLPEIWCV